ncbi:type I restriction enzyme, S subunit [Spiroplasma kunkelii CR2-3x]|uniref:Type I restriction enzyme, S subunit n=1 Tax=Spiroplasma kunkelii CR2-3x TaxID=273035 RepID=A0A0K2JH87_SPIKU|nr:restriction endonuclease subunit S [Spiroplasma kunkelii]ALA97783.1 type I restriction enzyme, S subunit [Spiroplasma kunkelii CR2-3x]
MNKSLVPKIRFKEFINENNFQKIIFKKNDIIKIKTGKSDTKNALEIGKYTFFDRSEKIKRSNKYIFHGEYIIIPGEGSFLPTYFNGKFDLHQRAYALTSVNKSKIINKYLFYFIIKNNKNFNTFSVGTTVSSLRLSSFEWIFKKEWPKISEQIKVAHFFTIIDRKIELIKEQLSLLEKQKQYYLKNMFTNEKSYPKIRFKDFNDEWKKYKINEIYKLKRGCVISKEILLKNKEANFFPVYSSQTSNNGIMGWTNSYLFEKNKIIWTTDGANAGTIRFVNENFYASNVCGVLIGKKDHYNNYSFAISISLEAKKHINKNGNPKLMNNIMGNINFYNSKLKNEQNLIGHFFSIIDRKIELVKEQLSFLEKQKQYYLNNIFI